MSGAVGPAYRVVTPRLVVRCLAPADTDLVAAAMDEGVDHLRPFMPWSHREPIPREERVAWLRHCRGMFDLGQDFLYGIFSADESRVLGGTGLHTRRGPYAREIGYWIAAGALRRGYATETAAALTQVAILVDGVHRVEIRCEPANVPSARIPEKLGFRLEGTAREDTPQPDGRTWRDTRVYALLAGELVAESPVMAVRAQAFDVMGKRLM